MKDENRVRHYKHAPTPEDPDPITCTIDWGARTIVTGDGEVVNVHAEKDKAALERDKTAMAEKVAAGALEGKKAALWLSEKAKLEACYASGKPGKATVAHLDKLVAVAMQDPETEVGYTYLVAIAAEAAARNASRIYWMLKELTDMDNRRQT